MRNSTTRRDFLKISGAGIGAALAAKDASAEETAKPLTLPLECAGKDCSLLRGKPQTYGMRSGFVRLSPGETIGWHSTGKYEETLVILSGEGAAEMEAAWRHAPRTS